ncbi:MAG: dTDP-4-dehydrorhamnose 3,5-epimerase family protein [Chloroflexota bacterium]|nr:dTDP-4-dehydrorhamnose 3,5-epimerase family protein [Chloroflexota bacterium]
MTTIRRVQENTAHQLALRALVVRDGGTPSPIAGVTLRELRVNRDDRGTLTELLRSDWPDLYDDRHPFAQAYVSMTLPGVARDDDRWHVHVHQTDRFYCLAGAIVVAIADGRASSPTNGQLMLVELSAIADAPAPLVVTIPPGTLHGFVVTSDVPAMLMNFPTRLYDPADEGRVPFADAGILTPGGRPFSYDAVRALYA